VLNGSGEKFELEIIEDIRIGNQCFVISVLIPVFNQEAIIADVLTSLVSCMTLRFELIIIDDASCDDSLARIMSTVTEILQSDLICRLRIGRHKNERFETACDVESISVTDSTYILEIQSDMILEEVGFDKRMIEVLEDFDDLIAVSGRGTESLIPIGKEYKKSLGSVVARGSSILVFALRRIGNRLRQRTKYRKHAPIKSHIRHGMTAKELALVFPPAEQFEQSGEAGRLGILIDKDLDPADIPRDRIWVGQTVMRGPLLFNREKYLRVGGLDTARFFLGFDDHDLMCRALEQGLRGAYLPIIFSSPVIYGSTRTRRSWRTEISILKQLWRIRKTRKQSSLYQFAESMNTQLPRSEIRFLR
jgi:GT2 family glycosyltransferase